MLSNNSSEVLPATISSLDYNAFKPTAGAFPGLLGSYLDTAFGSVNAEGSTVVRLTEDSPTDTQGQDLYAHHWLNCDGTYFFYQNTSGTKEVRSTADGSVVRSGVPYTDETSWHPTDPDKFFYHSGATLREYTVSTGGNTILFTFAASIGEMGGSQDNVDATGTYFTFVYNSGGNGARVWKRGDAAVYTGTLPSPVTGGYFHMTADAQYLIRVDNSTFTAYPLNHSTKTVGAGFPFWTEIDGDHAGFASCSDGKVRMLRMDNFDDGALWIVEVKDQTGKTGAQMRADAANTSLLPFAYAFDGHMSGVGKGTFQDWVFMETEYPDDTINRVTNAGNWIPYASEIIAVNLRTQEWRRLAHHRSRSALDLAYDNQPRVSCSWDGSAIIWASNMNITSAGGGKIDIYGIFNPLGTSSSSFEACWARNANQ